MRLAGKTALITGATSGIGEATAVMFAEEGAGVAIIGRDADRGHAVQEQIRSAGGQAVFVRADVRRSNDCERAVGETFDAFGRLDVLFNNAVTYVANDAVGCSEEEWDEQIDTSLKGRVPDVEARLPHMVAQGSGSIVNCSSGWGLIGGRKRSRTARPRAAWS
jgi:NADP-dependent 3-hydroxy acid dehydrogenase YdfG